MRINFNCGTGRHLKEHDKPDWLKRLVVQYLEEYDINASNDQAQRFMYQPAGVRMFAEWLAETGFQAKYWEIDWRYDEGYHPIGFGIWFDEQCPRFVEAKLKSCE